MRFAAEVPRAGQLTDPRAPVDRDYYLRHRIETVRRIRGTARTDALALAAMVVEDYEAARRWSRYATEELDHDRMFLADLQRHGIDEAHLAATPPLRSTAALLAFLTEEIARQGSLPAVAYSIFVEWNSARYSRPAVDRAEAAFGTDAVRGARAHLAIDVGEAHYAEMIRIAHRLTAKTGTDTLVRLIRETSALLRAYFVELHELTSGMAPRA